MMKGVKKGKICRKIKVHVFNFVVKQLKQTNLAKRKPLNVYEIRQENTEMDVKAVIQLKLTLTGKKGLNQQKVAKNVEISRSKKKRNNC